MELLSSTVAPRLPNDASWLFALLRRDRRHRLQGGFRHITIGGHPDRVRVFRLKLRIAIYQGRQLFKALANRMEQIPELRVRIFLNIHHSDSPSSSEKQILSNFLETFRDSDWPGQKLPELFYDPRSLLADPAERASLHAKCVIVDEERAFITSANFTEAAQERNIEAGVLLAIPGIAKALCSQFETLVAGGLLKRLT
jgi:phosphatidylserine/phosphatidylglycerophosphate/cardiolipin synthase-like enzyme